ESQLRQQGAEDKIDEVLAEIPRVREDLGFIPLVTPTSQIVGTQAVINVLMGVRYKNIAKETAGVLRGEYGATPAPVSKDLQARVLDEGESPITCRPADLIDDEMEALSTEFKGLVEKHKLDTKSGDDLIDDVLTYALFPQVGLKFIQNRNNPSAFEPIPTGEQTSSAKTNESAEKIYTVEVDGQSYTVTVTDGGDVSGIAPIGDSQALESVTNDIPISGGDQVNAPLAGNVISIPISVGQHVKVGDTVLVLEAMKMETNITASKDGQITIINVREGDSISVGDSLLSIA
ncbi:MAG: oxaloacetate decarboxylase alpha subunit, partial [Arenicella sp.]